MHKTEWSRMRCPQSQRIHLVASYEVFVFGADALVFFTAVGGASGYGGHTGGAFDMMPEEGHGVDQGDGLSSDSHLAGRAHFCFS